eukprot:CAMPEP_0113499098 /NCGR_PEP_ID=MMETSP0014_2-20120614/31555_1 /TAXON_ID=2857 /ORGANISM="Nitzschia sp." /LENGTH=653 /DNA_ID=CAMNT_0000393227 /DNA_START=167 /DNA_END=2128 /DNA_ORIENTATION=- /assembly_acc=CAM_ASM_000159
MTESGTLEATASPSSSSPLRLRNGKTSNSDNGDGPADTTKDQQHQQHQPELPHRSITPPTITTTPNDGNIHPNNTDKIMLIIFGCCSIFFYAGAFYGWGPMQLLLEANGNFQNKCSDEWWEIENQNDEDSESSACPEQTSALLTCRFVSQMTVLTSPLWAFLSDKYGGQQLTYILFGTMTSGLVLLVIAFEYPATKWDGALLYTSFILMGIGSTCGGLLTVVTALVFPERSTKRDTIENNLSSSPPSSPNNDNINANDQKENSLHSDKFQSRLISLMNALYDAAAITYLTLWGLVQLTSNVVGVMIGYACFAVFFLGGYIFFFRRVRNQVGKEETNNFIDDDDDDVDCGNVKTKNSLENDDDDDDDEVCKTQNVSTTTSHKGRFSTATATTVSDESASKFQSVEESTSMIPANEKPLEITNGLSNQQDKVTENIQPNSTSSPSTYITISKRSFVDQMKSRAFILLCTFFTIHFLSNIWTLTTMRDFLKYLGDDDEGNKYLAIFTLLTPVSLVALPFVDIAIHRYGYSTALQVVNTLDMIQCLIKVVPGANLNVQIVGFVVFSFFRCFLFCVTFSCMPTIISSDAAARATSCMYVVSSAATFINIPLVNLAVESQDGNFFIPNLFFLFLTVPGAVFAWMLGKAIRRDWESQRIR